jgi:uncharacterized protein YndB with AHSA1/START domain
METSQPIIITQSFNAPVDKVWHAITQLDQMKKWYLPELEDFKPVVGFETQFNVHFDGKDYLHYWKITEVISGKKLMYIWRFPDYPGESLLSFELLPIGDKTELKLAHSGIESFPQDVPGFTWKDFSEGWTELICKNLKEYMDNDK